MKRLFTLLAFASLIVGCAPKEASLTAGKDFSFKGDYTNFELSGQALTEEGAEAVINFCADAESSGYEVLLANGPIDGSLRTGSLLHVRNLYKSFANDGEWFDFDIAVRGDNIAVSVNGIDLVCYTQPAEPYRTEAHAGAVLGKGKVSIKGLAGNVQFRNLTLTALADDAVNPAATLPAVDEQNDDIIRLQQQDFPVIDYHVHLKGGLTKEMAHEMSMNYGINYGVAPNAGEGGVGRMLADDDEIYAYYEEVRTEPFLFGVQGEGRKWTSTFSQDALGIFEYLFTDAMTIIDHKGRNSRIYRPEEVHFDGVTQEQYMDMIVDQTVRILTNEPADIYANPTFIPAQMQADYDKLWTDERIDRVLDVLEQNKIALEINPRYKIPGMEIIKKAKARGIKFTFGTNNVNADFGKLEYALQAIKECGITPEDLWFPTMSIRRTRPVVIYNHFE